jgi:protein-arginine kinase activator protein McsA
MTVITHRTIQRRETFKICAWCPCAAELEELLRRQGKAIDFTVCRTCARDATPDDIEDELTTEILLCWSCGKPDAAHLISNNDNWLRCLACGVQTKNGVPCGDETFGKPIRGDLR